MKKPMNIVPQLPSGMREKNLLYTRKPAIAPAWANEAKESCKFPTIKEKKNKKQKTNKESIPTKIGLFSRKDSPFITAKNQRNTTKYPNTVGTKFIALIEALMGSMTETARICPTTLCQRRSTPRSFMKPIRKKSIDPITRWINLSSIASDLKIRPDDSPMKTAIAMVGPAILSKASFLGTKKAEKNNDIKKTIKYLYIFCS